MSKPTVESYDGAAAPEDINDVAAKDPDQVRISHVEDGAAKLDPQPALRIEHIHGSTLVLAFFGWLLTEFMGGMGGNMLAPALPVIASEFNALGQMGWVSGAFYMTQCGSMLLFGQCSQIFDAKYVLIAAILFFALGSAISGGAHDVTTLIAGRAVAGIGSAGCYIMVQTIVAFLVDLRYRPLMLGLFGLQNAVAGSVGPIIAGAFANSGDRNMWRMCFLIVLPLSVLTIAFNICVMPNVPPLKLSDEMEDRLDACIRMTTRDRVTVTNPTIRRWLLADWVGFIVVTCSLVCFILALQWGGSVHPWKSPQVIGTFVGFGLIMILFIWIEYAFSPWPLMPLRVFKNRSVVGGCAMALFVFMSNLFGASFIPYIYEAARGASSLKAAIDYIPYLTMIVAAQLLQSFIMGWTGRYWHWGVTSPALIAVAAGLLHTIKYNTSDSTLVGYVILYGLGVGFSQVIPIIAVQTDSKEEDIPANLSTLSFIQLFGGMCGPVIGNAILTQSLRTYLPTAGLDHDTVSAIVNSVHAIWDLTGDVRIAAIKAYLDALHNVFITAVPMIGIAIIAAFMLRDKNLRR